MGLLQPDQTEEPELSPDEEADLAAKELGEPLAVFRAGGRRAKLKVIAGVALVVYGLVANYFWWVHGPAKFGHIEFHLLIAPPIIGGGLLGFLYRNRGLRILVFPTGLLRLRPDAVESFPWEAVSTVRLKTDAGEPVIEYSETGEIANCWLPVTVPLVQVWNAWFEIERHDGMKSRFRPAVAEYPELGRMVQTGTFAAMWPNLLVEFEKGGSVPFGGLSISREGLHLGGKSLAWSEVKAVTVVHKMVHVKKAGSWRAWWIKEISQVPNVHLLFGALAMMGVKKAEETKPEEKKPEIEEGNV